ncbi:hypothetical protein BGW38_008069 [Lunasporangiospora selenospora]|uniref:rRNA-processing protein EFG1 n=1 Tax=Lunasporangiospora selenospora TaxID=979761 RepID=A0A9P6FYT0_9FUNG|nr:hypothetical protein BGW38_008069 [Lunasporangiospora selenospora]
MEQKDEATSKKAFVRKVAPSKAPRRLLKRKIRDMERLVKNKDSLKDLPEQVVQDTNEKIADLKRQLQAIGEPSPKVSAAAFPSSSTGDKSGSKKSKSVKFTELRRAGRKISNYKRLHPNTEQSEDETKTLADLELDLLYIKHFPKEEEYISIYPDSPHTDEEQIRTQAEIRKGIHKRRLNGEFPRPQKAEGGDTKAGSTNAAVSAAKGEPVSNWSEDEDGEGGEERASSESDNEKSSEDDEAVSSVKDKRSKRLRTK